MGRRNRVLVTIVIQSARGRIEVIGPGARLTGRLGRTSGTLRLGEEVHALLHGDDGDRLALLGRVTRTGTGHEHLTLKPGRSFEAQVLLVVRNGHNVPASGLFGTGPAPLPAEAEDGTSPLKAAPPAAGPPPGLTGDLAELRLIDLIQALELSSKTGRVEIAPAGSGEASVGEVFLEDGQVTHVFWNHLEGEEAFFHLALVERGAFFVTFGERSPARTVSGPNTWLLMDALRRVDEDQRLKAERTQTEVAPPPAPYTDGSSFTGSRGAAWG